jgi:hypothetical protein
LEEGRHSYSAHWVQTKKYDIQKNGKKNDLIWIHNIFNPRAKTLFHRFKKKGPCSRAEQPTVLHCGVNDTADWGSGAAHRENLIVCRPYDNHPACPTYNQISSNIPTFGKYPANMIAIILKARSKICFHAQLFIGFLEIFQFSSPPKKIGDGV